MAGLPARLDMPLRHCRQAIFSPMFRSASRVDAYADVDARARLSICELRAQNGVLDSRWYSYKNKSKWVG